MKIVMENRNNDLIQRNDVDALVIENNIIKCLSIITETRDKIIPYLLYSCTRK